MFRLLTRREIDANNITGNVVIGDVNGTVIQNFNAGAPPSVPILNWRKLPDGELDVFKAMQWQFRISALHGRDNERNELLNWARTGPKIRLRLLTGPGGAGKSRLAAEVAQTLNDEGWNAGFARRDADGAIYALRDGGLFLILDYPEEDPQQIDGLMRALAEVDENELPCNVRLLLLTRQSPAEWQPRVDAAHADAILDNQSVTLAQLETGQAATLYREASDHLADHLGREALGVGENEMSVWQARDAVLHGLPLIVTAAAIHGVLEPGQALGIDGREVVQALVRREIARLNNAGRAAGLGENGGGRLSAMAVLRGEVDAACLRRLAAPKLEMDLPTQGRIVDAVSGLPWWDGGKWAPPQPDIAAAVLLHCVLQERTDIAREWLWAALQDSDETAIERLGRVDYDISLILGGANNGFSRMLVDMLGGDVERAMTLSHFAFEERLPPSLAPVAVRVEELLLRNEAQPETRAIILNNWSVHKVAIGDAAGALAAAREAVAIHRDLAAARPEVYRPDLARSLNNLGNMLSDNGEATGALAAAREAVAIRRELAAARPEVYRPDLAASLNNLSIRLSENGDAAGALAAAQEAVAIYRHLAAAQPKVYRPDLGRSLYSLANWLSENGNAAGALAAAEEAVAIQRDLAAVRPEVYRPDLAASLNNLSIRLSENGDAAGALAVVREAVAIRRDLAAARPEVYRPGLAASLNNLGNWLSDNGNMEGALAAAWEAVAIYRDLAAARPEVYRPDLAASLNNLGARLSENGDTAAALAAAQEAIETLAPAFHALPRRHAALMKYIAKEYLLCCIKEDIEPDAALLDPIIAKLKRLADEGDGEAG